jgi:hypothetical protein
LLVPGVELGQAQVGEARRVVVVHTIAQHGRLLAQELDLGRRVQGGLDGHVQKPGDGFPFAARRVALARRRKQALKLLGR